MGLAISAPLLAAFEEAHQPESELWSMVELPSAFTPTMFVEASRATASSAVDVMTDLTTAHEFAHTAGLVHSSAPENLMQPVLPVGRASCRWGLDDQQLARLADQLAPTSADLAVRRTDLRAARPARLDPRWRGTLGRWRRGDAAAPLDLLHSM
jgi:hypothetical protein